MEFLRDLLRNALVTYPYGQNLIGQSKIVKYNFTMLIGHKTLMESFAYNNSMKITFTNRSILVPNSNYEKEMMELEVKEKQVPILQEKFNDFIKQCEKDGIKDPYQFFNTCGYCCDDGLISIR